MAIPNFMGKLPRDMTDIWEELLRAIRDQTIDNFKDETPIQLLRNIANLYRSQHPKAKQCKDMIWKLLMMTDNKQLPSTNNVIYLTLLISIEYCKHYEVIK